MIWHRIWLVLVVGALQAAAIADDTNEADLQLAPQSEVAPEVFGIDRHGMDRSVAPGTDFYRFANGVWYDTATIEPGQWQTGTLQSVRAKTDDLAAAIVKDLRRKRWPEGSNEAKFLTIYRNYTNRDARRATGLRPIRPFLDLIDRASSHEEIATLLGSYSLDAGGLFRISLRVDPLIGRGYVASVEPAKLLLESRSLYLRTDALATTQRAETQELLGRLLRKTEFGLTRDDRIIDVMALETRLATLYPDAVTERQPVGPEHVFVMQELEEAFPEFPWQRYFSARGLRETTPIHIRITERMDEIITVFNETPLQVWKDYLSLRLILDYGSYLDESTALLIHRFDMARLGAEYAPRKRRERAWRVALDLLPDPIGQAYIDEHLSDQTIAEVQKMVGWTLAAYRERIEVAEWLTDETRARAIEKLNAINVVVGEPPGWNNFDGYTPVRGSLFSNAYTRQQLRHQSALSRLRVPEADRAEEPPDPTRLLTDIFFSPLGVGAYYLPTLNTIVIPAAYLQRPYYDPSASVAVNFGALGTTLGHELGHAFDDQGAKRGPHGQLQNWWQDGDSERYRALGANLSAHLSAFEAAPGIPLNTQLTLGENLSDLAGIEIAWRALELAKSASGETSISDEEARAFFISYAQKRRAKRLPTVNINFAYSDPHSPPAVRVNGILPHIDSWYEAFDITEDDPLWLAPEDRIRIW